MSSAPTLRLYNTLTREVEPVAPIEPGHLRFYSCGPTVYTYAHIGNFRSFLTADLIVRTAQAIGWETTYVSNVTDVGHLTADDLVDPSGEDKMAAALEREGERFANIYDLARFYTRALLDDWRALNLREPDVRPRATEHVSHQIKAVERLVEAGYAYETAQGIYFSVASFPDYGKLSGNRSAENLEAGVREELIDDPEKRDPRDFALWKKDPKHLMQWHSPWGWGFPGWHIECSVMSTEYLGPHIDLHAGGEDLIFPHHECEIAQSESLTGDGRPFARTWVHTRFLQVEGEKMSKSKGNFFTVRDLIEPDPNAEHIPEGIRQQGGIDPLALRLALISGQYRKPLNFTLDSLRSSIRHTQRLREAQNRIDKALEQPEPPQDNVVRGMNKKFGSDLDSFYDQILEAMLDDLNTPVALREVYNGVKRILSYDLDKKSALKASDWLKRVNSLLGIVKHEGNRHSLSVATMPDSATHVGTGTAELPSLRAKGTGSHEPTGVDKKRVEELIDEREAARAAGNYDRADAIRDELDAMDVEVMDTPEGTTWRRKVSI